MTEGAFNAMSGPVAMPSGGEGATGGESAVVLGDAFQQVAQGLARLQEALLLQGQEAMRRQEDAERMHQEAMRRQEQEAERRLQDALRLQEQRAETVLRDAVGRIEAKLQEQDDAIRALVQRLEKTHRGVAVVERRPEGLEESAGEGALRLLGETQERVVVVEGKAEGCEEQEALLRLEGRMQEVEASLQRAIEKFFPRVDGLLRHLQTSPPKASFSPSSPSTSSDETCGELATGRGGAVGRRKDNAPPVASLASTVTSSASSTPSSTAASALGATGAAGDRRGEPNVGQGAETMDERRQRQRIQRRIQDVDDKMMAARNAPSQQGTELLSAVRNGRLSQIKRLLDAGAEANYIDQYGIIPLLVAVQWNQHDVVDLLLQRGADANAVNFDGASAMHFAATFNHHRLLDLLVAAGGDVNSRAWNGATPLLWAARGNNAMAVRALLAAGARRDLGIWEGPDMNKVPLHCATSTEIKNLLRS